MLSWVGVPDELTWWQDKARQDVKKRPQFDPSTFKASILNWWTCLQPDWRGPSLSRDVPSDHSWRGYKVGGPKGLILFIMCLSWVMADFREDNDIVNVVEDLTWVLQQFDTSQPPVPTSGDFARASPDNAAKRVDAGGPIRNVAKRPAKVTKAANKRRRV